MTLRDLAEVATAAGSVLGILTLMFIAVQLRDSRRFTQAQLVNTLENEFRSLYPVYSRLLPEGAWGSGSHGPITSEDLWQIESYIQYFERMQMLLELGALDLPNLDRMYSYRFFLVMHNVHVQEQLLYPFEDYYPALITLYRNWYSFRASRDLPFPSPETRARKGFGAS